MADNITSSTFPVDKLISVAEVFAVIELGLVNIYVLALMSPVK